MGIYWDNRKENGSYHIMGIHSVQGLGFFVFKV